MKDESHIHLGWLEGNHEIIRGELTLYLQ